MKKILLFSIATVVALPSCVKNDDSADCPVEIRFAGNMTPAHTRVGGANGELWTQGDHIGIYMIKANPGTLDDTHPENVISANAPYDASASTATAPLLPVATPLFYPADDSEVKFVAYHPYDRTRVTSDYRLEVDLLNNQGNPSAIDLLYAFTAGSSYKKSTATEVPLLFEHKLVKLVFTFTYAPGVTAPADNAITAVISGQQPRASLSLRYGNATGVGSQVDITATGTTTRVEAIVAPNPSTEGIVFTFTNAAGSRYTAAAPLLTTGWTGGFRYTYNIVLRDDATRITGSIAPWIDDNNSDNGNVSSIDAGKVPTRNASF
jgi:hypothetical protein